MYFPVLIGSRKGYIDTEAFLEESFDVDDLEPMSRHCQSCAYKDKPTMAPFLGLQHRCHSNRQRVCAGSIANQGQTGI